MTFLLPIRNGKVCFQSEYHRAKFNDWLKLHNGKVLRVELNKNPVSDKVRGYYFGAIIPTVRSAVKEWEKLSDDDIHEILKKMFSYFDAFNPMTKRVERFGRTTMSNDSNTERAMNFVENIRVWCAENFGLELPNPAEYKDALDRTALLD